MTNFTSPAAAAHNLAADLLSETERVFLASLANTAKRRAAVRAIGKADQTAQQIAVAVVESVADGYDWSKRGARPAAIHLWINGGDDVPPVTDEHNKRTTYGKGVDLIGKYVAELTTDAPDAKPVTLRATLSGEGGGSTVIPTDHPLYAAIVALIEEGQQA